MDGTNRVKDRLGAFIHHQLTSLVVVVLIMISVSLVCVHLLLPVDDPFQGPIEALQVVITVLFAFELGTKYYVAPSKARYFATYWVDIIAVIPWAQSLRVLRILRLLRVFRVAVLLSRRFRFVSALFRSAVGEYVVLCMIMGVLLAVGTFTLYISEVHARAARTDAALTEVGHDLAQAEVDLGIRHPDAVDGPAFAPQPTADRRRELVLRLDAAEMAIRSRLDSRDTFAAIVDLPAGPRERLRRLAQIRQRLPAVKGSGGPEDLAQFENSFWATLFFLVATEPMFGTPSTTIGRVIVLGVMFGGLTTFALFTGIVTALMVNRLKRRLEIDDMDRFQLVDHLIILGWNRLVPLIIDEITQAPGHQDTPVVVLADLEEHPPEVAEQAGNGRVYFVRGDYTKPETLDQIRVRYAKRAIIVADTTIPRSDQDRDARTVLAALMIERMNPEIYTCAELLNKDNEVHLRAAGIEEVVVTTDAGGHHLALAALHEGLADVMNELMTGSRGCTLLKVPVPEEFVGLSFAEGITRCKHERNTILVGLETKGQEGPRVEGYAMRVNPPEGTPIGATDNLVVISAYPGT